MYNAQETEKKILEFWKEKKIFEKLKGENKNGKKFYFLQGPPYTSGRLHIGHAWNNSMKDIFLRYKRMQGYDVWDRAGYDMHGLPTENAVQKMLHLKDKDEIIKFGIAKFVEECKNFSVKNAKLMDADLLRLGVWLDYENAYYPITNEFIEGEWWLIKKAFEQGRLYKGKKVMHWCINCETALAKHELEYEKIKEESIFLKFKLKGKNEFLVVWTTTPWTIPHNLAIMATPNKDYVKVKAGNEIWIAAKQSDFLKEKKFKVLQEFKGKELEGLEYKHPFHEKLKRQFSEFGKIHRVVLSEQYVTEEGSGLVHCAPGCGQEDFEAGKKYKLQAFNNTDEKGIFFDMNDFSGLVAKKDDEKFTKLLEKENAVIEKVETEHEYPHCWRCHEPVIFRTTEQWFFKIEDLVEEMRKANNNAEWIPSWGKNALDEWLKFLRDDSITRQRFWGAPVPIWECSCGSIEVISSLAELEKKSGKKVKELHRPFIDEVKIKCKCGKEMSRVKDVIDVWIDAGTLSWNCLYYPSRSDLFEKLFPADFILEATEQIKLWFSVLLICSMIAFRKPCYKTIYMHGMILDWQGMKMSKSLGNIISPYEVIDKYSADILRYYMCGTSAGENINFSWKEAEIKRRNLEILWNLHNFLRTGTKKIKKVGKNEMGIEERYIISRLNSTIKEVTELFEKYKIDETITRIEFLFLELSHDYLQAVREKIAQGQEDIVFFTVNKVLMETIKMFSTICPFITEEIYQNIKQLQELQNEKDESVHFCKWPKADENFIDKKLEEEMQTVKKIIVEILAQREKAKIGIRWPLLKVSVDIEKPLSAELKELIMRQTNIKNIETKKGNFFVKLETRINVELEAEGFAREICRNIQDERKKAGLIKENKIFLTIETEKEMQERLKKHEEMIKRRTNAIKLEFCSVKYKNMKDFLIKEKKFAISFEKK